MKRYRVVMNYVLTFDLEINATDKDDARKQAQIMTLKMSNDEFVSRGEPLLTNIKVTRRN